MTAPIVPTDSIGRRPGLRRLVHHMLGGDGHGEVWVRAVDYVLIALIVLNVMAVVLESLPDLAIAHGPVFHAFDVLSVAVFSLEYLARLWSCVEGDDPRFRHPLWGRLRWMATPMAIIDLVAVLPFYLGMFVEMDLRAIRVLRVLRVFKLGRYSVAMNVLVAVARQEARSLNALMFLMAVVVIFFGSLVYLFEHNVQPQVFSDIPSSMWWAVVTLTTLGYGDMVPATPMGKVVGAITAVLGVGMVALPAGVLASGFSEQMRLRRAEYREALEEALEDGEIDRRERRVLEETREQLGLSEDEAALVLREAVEHPNLCPHCGGTLHS